MSAKPQDNAAMKGRETMVEAPEEQDAQPTLATASALPSSKAAVGQEKTVDMPTEETHDKTHADDGLASRETAEADALDQKIRAHLDKAPDRKKDPLIGELVGGRFLVVKKIGAGGMGAVYRAKQEGMDRDVAVKVLLGDLSDNETVLRRFTLEALAVSRLKHPNTIQIFDYGQTPRGYPYIAMEMLDGLTLHDVLRKERPLPIRRSLRIMHQIAASLAEAHGKGIVHRDLKPENIFLVPVGDNPDFVKVLDFGVAKLRDKNDDKGTLTQAGSIFGTPRYMSPEQCSALPVDGRSDLYALGVILYEMITGKAPFVSDQPLSLLLAHVNDAPPPPSTVTDKQAIPAEVEEMVLKLLEKRPEDRIQEAGDLSNQCLELSVKLPSAFDLRVGTAEAENLGVRLLSAHTLAVPTARTMKGGDSGAPTLQVEMHRRKLMWPLIGFGAAGIATLGIALALTRKEPAPAPAPAAAVAAPVAAPSELVDLTVTTSPPGATIIKDGLNIATTNAQVQRKRGAPGETWQLVRDGYESMTVQVGFDAPRTFHFELKRLPPTATVVALPAPTPDDKAAPLAPGGIKPKPKGKTEVVGTPTPQMPQPKVEPKAVTPQVTTPEPKPKPKPKNDQLDDLQ